MKFYTSVAKGLKLKVRRFWGLIPMFVEVTEEKLVGGFFAPPTPPILNRVSGWYILKSFSQAKICFYLEYYKSIYSH